MSYLRKGIIVKRKRIYLNTSNTKYCTVWLFKHKREMQEVYEKYTSATDNKIAGAHSGHTAFVIEKDGTEKITPCTGIVFLCYERCGAGIVSHEFLHAVLWAWGHGFRKVDDSRFPIVIKNLIEEEEVCYNLTYAVGQFYKWLYGIEDVFK